MSEHYGVRELIGNLHEIPPLYSNFNYWFGKLTVETETVENGEAEQRLSGIIILKSMSKWKKKPNVNA